MPSSHPERQGQAHRYFQTREGSSRRNAERAISSVRYAGLTIKTATECVIVRVEKAAIIRVTHDEPAFSEMFIAHLLARTIRVEVDLIDQLFNSSKNV